MKFTQSVIVASALLVGAFAQLQEDSLHSKRNLGKRFIDSQGNYNISFYHINDVHAHLDEFRSSGTDCSNNTLGCFGGYSRVKTVIENERPGHKDSLFLNVGDEFQGTLFYSYYGGEKIAETLNQMGFDGMTLGNHEFDGGPEKLAAFLSNLTFPIISANIHSNNSILNATIKPFHIYPRYQLAVIGVTTEDTPSISSPGAGTTFSNVTGAVQNTINFIKSTTNITRIAAITHIGYEEDQRLAEATTGLQLIMGGHSHTLLGNMTGSAGTYPTIKTNQAGDEVFIVTAPPSPPLSVKTKADSRIGWGEYLGYIDVTYGPSGKILAYHGAPIHLTNATAQDPELQAEITAWRGPFEAFAAEVAGESNVELDQTKCRAGECLLGQFMADAMLAYRLNQSDTADFALINSGGVRATIDEGPITRGEVLTSFPFGNAIVEIEVDGDELWKTLEGVYTGVNQYNQKAITSIIQVSKGIEITWDSTESNGTRLVRVNIGDEPLDSEAIYNVVTLDFLAGGGDNIFQKRTTFDILDTQDEVLTGYIESQSPVNITLVTRVKDAKGTATTPSAGTGSPTAPAASASGTGKSSAGQLSRGEVSGLLAFGALVSVSLHLDYEMMCCDLRAVWL
ncbi:related to 5`-nucleotidase precursor [Rhynchosporium secalis]|uniref:Related to 5`-nucleotidase n=1 Tax=Rhynchosporium secalis TaxID=38038 RepID=A0A1E1MNG1_RHYSE|nr:related to 5`-nucleotidase precursor [Rhynchosporium secalis]